jgi:hypothetical protein
MTGTRTALTIPQSRKVSEHFPRRFNFLYTFAVAAVAIFSLGESFLLRLAEKFNLYHFGAKNTCSEE